MAKITFEITQHLAVLSENANGWTKEINLVSWNGRPPKYDIREWSEDHTSMSKGVTLTQEEMAMILETLNDIK
ncbi:MAG: YdbC family protein [Anaerofustis sp.]